MKQLTYSEACQFLEVYWRGILQDGLFASLKELGQSQNKTIKESAQTFLHHQVAGFSPQVSVSLMTPRFPRKIELLITMGFEQSNIDFILGDVVEILKANPESEVESRLEALIAKYSPLKTESICLECCQNEIKKIFARATAEKAEQVYLSYENSFIVQRYLATKLVIVQELAAEFVYTMLKKSINGNDRALGKALQLDISSRSDGTFFVSQNGRTLQIGFDLIGIGI